MNQNEKSCCKVRKSFSIKHQNILHKFLLYKTKDFLMSIIHSTKNLDKDCFSIFVLNLLVNLNINKIKYGKFKVNKNSLQIFKKFIS